MIQRIITTTASFKWRLLQFLFLPRRRRWRVRIAIATISIHAPNLSSRMNRVLELYRLTRQRWLMPLQQQKLTHHTHLISAQHSSFKMWFQTWYSKIDHHLNEGTSQIIVDRQQIHPDSTHSEMQRKDGIHATDDERHRNINLYWYIIHCLSFSNCILSIIISHYITFLPSTRPTSFAHQRHSSV